MTNLKHGDDVVLSIFFFYFGNEILSDLLHLPAIQLFFFHGIGWLRRRDREKKEREVIAFFFWFDLFFDLRWSYV